MHDLQHALGALFSLGPGSVERAIDLEHNLRVDKKLAWQIFRLVKATDAPSEAANVPARTSVRRLVSAARRAGAQPQTLARIADSFENFENFVSLHSGDRAQFLAMIRGIGYETTDRAGLNLRRSLFRGSADVWGVKAAMLTRTILHNKSEADEDLMDSVLVRGDIGLERLRQGTPLILTTFLKISNSPAWARGLGTDELDPGTVGSLERLRIEEPELLVPYCSEPLPEIMAGRSTADSLETELSLVPSGRTGAITLYDAQRADAAGAGTQSEFALNTMVRVPAEVMVTELLVPTGWTDPATARVDVYGRRGSVEQVFECRDCDLLPQREVVTHMGAFETSPPLPGGRNHSDAVRHVLKMIGWSGTRFDVYRCVVKYPVLHTMVRLTVDAVK